MAASIFWYDYESTGIDPGRDRPVQIAGVRTDELLNEVEAPVNWYCQLSDDILPHPMACLVTGIQPQTLQAQGLAEAEFMARIQAQLSRPGTCSAGYNTLRFDDEMTRYSLYRNFHDPYAREWKGGNSRWDLIDVVRTAYALRPEGLEWPTEGGRVTLRLERLTQANGLEHGQAHDALSDVRATLALARLIRDRQPRLFNYLYEQRSKHRVLERIRLLQPMVHISGRFSADRHYLSLVMPLAWHPVNRNALIVCDLLGDVECLLQADTDVLREHLYARQDNPEVARIRVPLKQIHVNRCPVLLPLTILREQDKKRLQLDIDRAMDNARLLSEQMDIWRDKIAPLYSREGFAEDADPEQQLYSGFLGDHDRELCERVRTGEPEELAALAGLFRDERMPELLFRYRARNYPQTLSEEERNRWVLFCRRRLESSESGSPMTIEAFRQVFETLQDEQRVQLSDWLKHLDVLQARYQVMG